MIHSKMVCLAVYLAILISIRVSSLPYPFPSVLQATKKVNNLLYDFADYDYGPDLSKSETLDEVKNHPDDSRQLSHPGVSENSQYESYESYDVYHAFTPNTSEHQPNFENYREPLQPLQSGGPIASAASEDYQDKLDCVENPERNVSTHSSSEFSEITEAESEEYDPECDAHLEEDEQLSNITNAFDSARSESSSASSDPIATDDEAVKLVSEHYYGKSERPYNLDGFSVTVSPDGNAKRLPGENYQLTASYNEKDHIFMLQAINRTRETLEKLNSILDVFGFRPITMEEQMNSEPSVFDFTNPALTDQSSNRERSVRDKGIIEWENLVQAVVRRLEDVSIQFEQFLQQR